VTAHEWESFHPWYVGATGDAHGADVARRVSDRRARSWFLRAPATISLALADDPLTRSTMG
jgi:hypothetical protein